MCVSSCGSDPYYEVIDENTNKSLGKCVETECPFYYELKSGRKVCRNKCPTYIQGKECVNRCSAQYVL